MKRWAGVAAAAVLVAALLTYAPRDRMRGAVRDFGFGDVRIGGFAWLGCGKDDAFRRYWTGRNRSGRPVSGVVCGGLGKGWTVRLTDPGR